MIRNTTASRRGFTLLETFLAVIIISTVAALSLQYMRPAGAVSGQRSCDATRQMLQNHADRYFSQTGTWPGRDLREIVTPAGVGDKLPACPCQGGVYQMSGAIVICPTHESTRK